MTDRAGHTCGPFLYFLAAPNGASVGFNRRDELDACIAAERAGDGVNRQCITCGVTVAHRPPPQGWQERP